MKKDIKKQITLEIAENLVEQCSDWGLEVNRFIGSLADEFTIDNSQEKIKFGRIVRKYVIIEEVYLNEWSSDLIITYTDNEEKYNDFIAMQEEAE